MLTQPDIPRCRGLKPGMPCPVPDNCECQRLSDAMDTAYRIASKDDRITLYVVCILVAVLTISLITIWKAPARAADVGNPSCMTKSQAQAKYPKQWLYWHTAHHCWDNQNSRVAGPFEKPPLPKGNRLPLYKPQQEPDGALIPKPIVVQRATVAYPDLMVGGGTDNGMLRSDAMTRWPIILDTDADPPRFEPWRERITGTGGTE